MANVFTARQLHSSDFVLHKEIVNASQINLHVAHTEHITSITRHVVANSKMFYGPKCMKIYKELAGPLGR